MRIGKALPAVIGAELTRCGVNSNIIPLQSNEGRKERIDLRVTPRDPKHKPIEFQITLRRNVEGKMAYFMRAAIYGERIGPRVYVEIRACYNHTLNAIARRVAMGLIEVTHQIPKIQLEEHGLLGVKLSMRRGKKPRLNYFSLFDTAGQRLRNILKRDKLRKQQFIAKRIRERRSNPRPFYPGFCGFARKNRFPLVENAKMMIYSKNVANDFHHCRPIRQPRKMAA
jgi:hypothetical protein